MKVIKTASGKKKLKLSKKEWLQIGKKAGWSRENYPVSRAMEVAIDNLGGFAPKPVLGDDKKEARESFFHLIGTLQDCRKKVYEMEGGVVESDDKYHDDPREDIQDSHTPLPDDIRPMP